jgi:hypothetical protein
MGAQLTSNQGRFCFARFAKRTKQNRPWLRKPIALTNKALQFK